MAASINDLDFDNLDWIDEQFSSDDVLPLSLLVQEDLPELSSPSGDNIAPLSFQTRQLTFSDPLLFAGLTLPTGIATDFNGNVFVTSEDSGPVLTVFDPMANVLGRLQLAPLISPVDVFGANRLAVDPRSGNILTLSPNGTIQIFDPATGSLSPALGLQSIPFATDAVYDIAQGVFTNFTGSINTQIANYGDIAIFNDGNVLDLYVSGISVVFPFVARIRFPAQGQPTAEVLVSSSATAAPNQGQPPGVAVNSQGTVLTTLPIPNANATGNFNAPVAFPVDLDPRQRIGSFTPFLLEIDVASTGMTTDAAGNFYIATSAVGTSLGGINGSGAVVVLPPTLNSFIDVLPIGNNQVTFASNDVAVSPSGDRLYVTFNDTLSPLGQGGVLLYQIADTATALDVSNSTVDNEVDVLTGSVPQQVLVSDVEASLASSTQITHIEDNLYSELETVSDHRLPLDTSSRGVVQGIINPESDFLAGVDPLFLTGHDPFIPLSTEA